MRDMMTIDAPLCFGPLYTGANEVQHTGVYPVTFIQALSTALMLLQIPVTQDVFQQISYLALTFSLIVCIGILWWSNTKKDAHIIRIIENNAALYERLAEAIDTGLLRMPCQLPAEDPIRKNLLG